MLCDFIPTPENSEAVLAAPDAIIYGSGNPQMQLQLLQKIFIILSEVVGSISKTKCLYI